MRMQVRSSPRTRGLLTTIAAVAAMAALLLGFTLAGHTGKAQASNLDSTSSIVGVTDAGGGGSALLITANSGDTSAAFDVNSTGTIGVNGEGGDSSNELVAVTASLANATDPTGRASLSTSVTGSNLSPPAEASFQFADKNMDPVAIAALVVCGLMTCAALVIGVTFRFRRRGSEIDDRTTGSSDDDATGDRRQRHGLQQMFASTFSWVMRALLLQRPAIQHHGEQSLAAA